MSPENICLDNFSAGLGQADVTQPGSFKPTGVHISLTLGLLIQKASGAFFPFLLGIERDS